MNNEEDFFCRKITTDPKTLVGAQQFCDSLSVEYCDAYLMPADVVGQFLGVISSSSGEYRIDARFADIGTHANTT